MSWPTVVDLYSGCGGVSAALRAQHFNVVAAVDNDPLAGRTYRQNNKNTHFYGMDIREVGPEEIRTKQLGGNDLDILVVCSPCQPFSNQNKNRKIDARSDLILEASRFARVLNPKIIFFENVPGLTQKGDLSIITKLDKGLNKIGYKLSEPRIIDMADYGVPQRRRRCVIFATLPGYEITLPEPTTTENSRITVRMAIGDLTSLKSGAKSKNDPLHFARKHQPITLKRMASIKKNGGDRFSLPPELELSCHKETTGYPDVYGRMWWDRVAPTLTTGCTDVTRGRYMHPTQNRAISLREAARLQTFPDSYVFEGNPGQVATQIGNAVPPAFVKAVAPALRLALKLS